MLNVTFMSPNPRMVGPLIDPAPGCPFDRSTLGTLLQPALWWVGLLRDPLVGGPVDEPFGHSSGRLCPSPSARPTPRLPIHGTLRRIASRIGPLVAPSVDL